MVDKILRILLVYEASGPAGENTTWLVGAIWSIEAASGSLVSVECIFYIPFCWLIGSCTVNKNKANEILCGDDHLVSFYLFI